MRLKDKVAIITGSARGLGQATALKFAAEGARVVVCDLERQAVDDVVAQIAATGGRAIGFTVNVTDKPSIAAMVKGVIDQYGRIDVLVNNAGIVDDAMFRKMTDEQFERVIDINLKGTYNCTKAVVDIMLEQQSGVIPNASSIVGLYGNFGQTNYVASKAGVIGMTRTWARELGRYKIRVNAVAPGYVATEILKSMPQPILDTMVQHTPLGRIGTTEDIANAYLWLASDQASFVTGHCLSVDGGVVVGT